MQCKTNKDKIIMVKFETYDNLKETYDTGKYDIFYENGNIKYEVKHIGSTILCYDPERNLGMGAVNNFDIKCFYGIEKPEPVIEEVVEPEENKEREYETD